MGNGHYNNTCSVIGSPSAFYHRESGHGSYAYRDRQRWLDAGDDRAGELLRCHSELLHRHPFAWDCTVDERWDGNARVPPGVGNHSYKAVFLGTPKGTLNATASTSGAVALQVSLPGGYSTETTIAQSGSPGSYTLTATVSGTGTTTPTGTIVFIDISNNAIAHEGSNEPLTTVTLAPVAEALALSPLRV